MKRIFVTAAALSLMSAAAIAQTPIQPADSEQAARRGTINQPTGAGSNPNAREDTKTQWADPEQAARKGAINQPSGAGSNPNAKEDTRTQLADPEQAARKGTINQPSTTTR
jgi:hypothetical protein